MDNAQRDKIIMENLNAGMSLSDLQQLLSSKYGIKITYLELRLLASTLKVNWSKLDKPKPKPQPTINCKQKNDDLNDADDEDATTELDDDDNNIDNDDKNDKDEGAGDGTTTVTIDDDPEPGYAFTGNVKFASGIACRWMMGRNGELGLGLDKDSKQPTQDDIRDFQDKLQEAVREKSMKMAKAAFDGRTKVEVSPLVKPGCDVNGTVQFASGAKGQWFIAGGKLDYELDEGSTKPTRQDLTFFQVVLSDVLKKKGY